MYLEKIRRPDDLKALDISQLERLAEEVREEILRTVSHNGGHLASNLGVVELTIALLTSFSLPEDKILLDVGHQCYPFKLLTGRFERFSSLRTWEGLSGFPQPEESVYDTFTAGHASTAISAALGLCRARDLKGEKHHVAAVVGDGALTGGMCFEALNDAGSSREPMIVILNDNGMSISGNTGAVAEYLTYMRSSKGWLQLKKGVSSALLRVPKAGDRLYDRFGRFKDHIRNIFVRDTYFDSLGFRYFGPIDGHNISSLQRVLNRVKDMHEPVLIHVVTQKGRGYRPAEDQPDVFHGVPPFYVESGAARKTSGAEAFGETASRALLDALKKGAPVAAVCAAMTDGTGFSAWKTEAPDRLFDVGIAEEHAVTMAAGMARGGMRPAVAVYDTFLQRGYDQMMEDVCQQNLPVLFLMDRAGFSGADGATHHGIFGLSYLNTMPHMRVYCPASGDQLRSALRGALTQAGPAAVRYPRYIPRWPEETLELLTDAETWSCVREGTDACLLAMGAILEEALKAADILAQKGISCAVYACCRVKPLDEAALNSLFSSAAPVFTVEEHELSGGFGQAVTAYCQRAGLPAPAHIFAVPDRFVPHGDRTKLLALCGLSAGQMADRIGRIVQISGEKRS